MFANKLGKLAKKSMFDDDSMAALLCRAGGKKVCTKWKSF